MPAFIISSPEFSFVAFDADLQIDPCDECDPLLLPAYLTFGIDFQFKVVSDLLADSPIYIGICNSDCENILDEDIQAEPICKRFVLQNLAVESESSLFNIQDPSTWEKNEDGFPVIVVDSDDGLEPDPNQMQLPFGTYTEDQLFEFLSKITGVDVEGYTFTACCDLTSLAFEVKDPDGETHNVVALSAYWDLASVHYPETPMEYFLRYYDYKFTGSGGTLDLCSFTTITVVQLVFEGDATNYSGTYSNHDFWDLIQAHLGEYIECDNFRSRQLLKTFMLEAYADGDSETQDVINFSRELISGTIQDGQCFRYCILDEDKNVVACSNLFRAGEECFTSQIRYSCNENSFGFEYPDDTVYNRIRLPFWIRKPEYPLQEKIQRKSGGRYKRLSTNIEKEYACITDYLPEWAHDRMIIALKHDSVIVTNVNAKIQDEEMMQAGAYDPEWDKEDQNVCESQASFKIKRNFNGINSNCKVIAEPCCSSAQLIEWTGEVAVETTCKADGLADVKFDITGISPQVTEYMLMFNKNSVAKNILYNGDFEDTSINEHYYAGWFSQLGHIIVSYHKLMYNYSYPGLSDFKGSQIMQSQVLRAGNTHKFSMKYQADKPFTGYIRVFKLDDGTSFSLPGTMVASRDITFSVDPLWQSVELDFIPAVAGAYLFTLFFEASDGDNTGIQFDDLKVIDTLSTQSLYLLKTIPVSASPSLTFSLDHLDNCESYTYALFGKVDCTWQFIRTGSIEYTPPKPTVKLLTIAQFNQIIGGGEWHWNVDLKAEFCGEESTYIEVQAYEYASHGLQTNLVAFPVSQPFSSGSPNFSNAFGDNEYVGVRVRVIGDTGNVGPWSNRVFFQLHTSYSENW